MGKVHLKTKEVFCRTYFNLFSRVKRTKLHSTGLQLFLSTLFYLALCVAAHAQNRVGCICKDNTYSTATGGGACSGHGGVKQWLYATQSMGGYRQNGALPAMIPADTVTFDADDYEEIRISDSSKSTNRNTTATQRAARVGCECSDGTFSKAIGSGACAGHGGVARWLYGGENLKDEVLTPTLRPRPADKEKKEEGDDGSFSYKDFERAGSLFVYILALVLVFLKVSWVLRKIMRKYLEED